MSDKRVREVVRTLLLDMKPAEIVAHVALELGFRPPLLMAVAEHPPREQDAQSLRSLIDAMEGLRSGGQTITPFVPLVVASDDASRAWGDVWVALSALAGPRPERSDPVSEPRFPLAASLGVTEDDVARALEIARQEGRQWLSEP